MDRWSPSSVFGGHKSDPSVDGCDTLPQDHHGGMQLLGAIRTACLYLLKIRKICISTMQACTHADVSINRGYGRTIWTHLVHFCVPNGYNLAICNLNQFEDWNGPINRLFDRVEHTKWWSKINRHCYLCYVVQNYVWSSTKFHWYCINNTGKFDNNVTGFYHNICFFS